MPSQRMPLRKQPTPDGKGVKLPEKSNFLSPTSPIRRSLFSSLPQNMGLQLAEEAAMQGGGESCRLGKQKQNYKEGGRGLGCDSRQIALAAEIEECTAVRV